MLTSLNWQKMTIICTVKISGRVRALNLTVPLGSGQTISGTGRVRASVLSPCRPLTPVMSCFHVSMRLRACSSRALSRLRALFHVGACCSDPGTHVLSFGFVPGFGHSRSTFCIIVWVCCLEFVFCGVARSFYRLHAFMLCQNILFHHSGWWNDLSTPIRNAGSLSIFKQQLKTHLCRHYLTSS